MQTQPRREAALQIIKAGQAMAAARLIVSTDGNLSARVSEKHILTTPAGAAKGELCESDLVLVDMAGNSIEGGRPSSELPMHLAIYEVRPDIAAVVHGHPRAATAFAAAGRALDQCLLPEVIVTMGKVPLASYATPSTSEVPDSVRALIREHNAILLSNHGALTVGKTVLEAFRSLETVEHFASIAYMAEQLGGAKSLNEEQVQKLRAIRGVYGLEGTLPSCVSSDGSAGDTARQQDDLARIIAEELARALDR